MQDILMDKIAPISIFVFFILLIIGAIIGGNGTKVIEFSLKMLLNLFEFVAKMIVFAIFNYLRSLGKTEGVVLSFLALTIIAVTTQISWIAFFITTTIIIGLYAVQFRKY